MTTAKKFDAYFDRLQLGSKPISLEFVAQLQLRHLAEFSFNSLAVLLERDISLNIDDIINKVVKQNWGGYCFEHNKLMHDALAALGFTVRCLIAKVINNQDIDTPRTHRITLLEWQNKPYLIDVGFGASCLLAPIKIEHNAHVECRGKQFRVVINKNQDFQLELLTPAGYFSLYTFNLQQYTEADCLMGHFYSHKYPGAIFVNNLVVSQILPELTLSLRNDQYHKICVDRTEVIAVADASHLQSIIEQDFGVLLSHQECDKIYNKVIKPAI